jgi:hypothetical protein
MQGLAKYQASLPSWSSSPNIMKRARHEQKATGLEMKMAGLKQQTRKKHLLTVKKIQGGTNMTGTNCDLFTHNQSRSYLNHLVLRVT